MDRKKAPEIRPRVIGQKSFSDCLKWLTRRDLRLVAIEAKCWDQAASSAQLGWGEDQSGSSCIHQELVARSSVLDEKPHRMIPEVGGGFGHCHLWRWLLI